MPTTPPLIVCVVGTSVPAPINTPLVVIDDNPVPPLITGNIPDIVAIIFVIVLQLPLIILLTFDKRPL